MNQEDGAMRNLEMNKMEPEMLTWEELLEKQGTPVYILEAMENRGYWAIPWALMLLKELELLCYVILKMSQIVVAKACMENLLLLIQGKYH